MKPRSAIDTTENVPENEAARHLAQVAARLFAEQGYDATSIRNIVEAAGVTKPTLYYHFGSKEGLAQALLTRPMTNFVARLRDCLTQSDDPVANLIAQVDAHIEFIREDADRGRFYYALCFGPLGSSLSSEFSHFTAQLSEAFVAGVNQVVNSGVVDPARASSFGMACRGAIVIHTMEYLYKFKGPCGHPSADESPDLASRIVLDLIRGFGASPASH